MSKIKTTKRHPLYHDLRERFKLSNRSLAAICDSHPNSVSYLLFKQRNLPNLEKKLYKLHAILKKTFPLGTEVNI